MSPPQVPARAIDRPQKRPESRLFCTLLLCAIALALFAGPAPAATVTITAPPQNASTPQLVKVGVYVMDFKKFSVDEGTVQVNFYLSLRSDSPVSVNEIELVKGHITTVDTLTDTPNEKYYRVFAAVDADPDLRHYPFDRHVLTIEMEPRTRDTGSLVFLIDEKQSGLDPEANLPGWEYGTTSSHTDTRSGTDEPAFSQAVFHFTIQRDTPSTVLKFFLPILLIIIVSLSSLLMKVTPRLGLNASMFLAAVLIHWRVADAIPLVAYATFLDIFMIITYATLVMVLVSGILIMKCTEAKDTEKVDLVYRWSVRIIPALSIVLYAILFVAFLR